MLKLHNSSYSVTSCFNRDNMTHKIDVEVKSKFRILSKEKYIQRYLRGTSRVVLFVRNENTRCVYEKEETTRVFDLRESKFVR